MKRISIGPSAYGGPCAAVLASVNDLLNLLVDVLASARGRNRLAVLHDLHTELAEFRGGEQFDPADDLTGLRVLAALACLLAQTQHIALGAVLICAPLWMTS